MEKTIIMRKKFIGKIDFFTVSQNTDPRYLAGFEIRDARSGDILIRGEMPFQNLGQCLLSSETNFEGEYFGGENLGKKREVKREQISLPKEIPSLYNKPKKEQLTLARQIIHPYEIDGWQGRDIDLLNHHNFNSKTKKYEVVFIRYVEDDPDENSSNHDHLDEL